MIWYITGPKSEEIYEQIGRVSLILWLWKYTWMNISFVITNTPGA